MARKRQGRSLAADIYGSLRDEILFGSRCPGERLHLTEISRAYDVSLSVVREAVTKLASEHLVQATPQHGFRVQELSERHLTDLTYVRIELESLALRDSIAKGDVAWEGRVISAHHVLAKARLVDPDGKIREEWMLAHRDFHQALTDACESDILKSLRGQLFDASELYRYWSGRSSVHRDVAGEHQHVLEAALNRDADAAVLLITEHIRQTTKILLAAASETDAVPDVITTRSVANVTLGSGG